MIEIKDKKDCCGCWACENVCPKECIRMTEDNEGFRYPVVDAETCINCSLCEKVCPVIHASKEDVARPQMGFLAQHKNEEIRRQSTSGGAFTAIATWVIRQGGIVFGAGYRNGTFVVEHQAVERVEELAIFRNSKYVQSQMGNCYRQVLNYLKDGRLVLFSGTPCQIEGLIGFLKGKEYNNLYLIDFVCRGVPSPKVLDRYLQAQHEIIGGETEKVFFRDKYYGYHYSSLSLYNKDTAKDYHKGVDSDAYLRAFFNNLSDRPSCYECPFRKRYRKSDLTLWDCFPIEKFTKKMDGKGTTRILVQSEKGDELMANLNDLRLLPVDADKLTAGVREMFYSVPMNPRRERFFEEMNTMEPVAFLQKWFPITWKVRLNAFVRLTCHRLGVYTLAKRFFMLFYKRRDERCASRQLGN